MSQIISIVMYNYCDSTKLGMGVGADMKKTMRGAKLDRKNSTKNNRSRTMAANSHSSAISACWFSSLTRRVSTPVPSKTLFCSVFRVLLRFGIMGNFLLLIRLSDAPECSPTRALMAGSLFDLVGDPLPEGFRALGNIPFARGIGFFGPSSIKAIRSPVVLFPL